MNMARTKRTPRQETMLELKLALLYVTLILGSLTAYAFLG